MEVSGHLHNPAALVLGKNNAAHLKRGWLSAGTSQEVLEKRKHVQAEIQTMN
jgi:hypothetical protein